MQGGWLNNADIEFSPRPVEEAYEQACDQFGAESPQALAAAEAFEKVKAGWLKFKAGATHAKDGVRLAIE